MNKQATLALLTSLLLVSTGLTSPASELLDGRVGWEGSMPVQTHDGHIKIKSFDATLDDQNIIADLVVTLDMTTITVEDITREKDRLKLEGHLKSEDFFHVDQHPTATFTLKSHRNNTLEGTLTIRGISQDADIPASLVKQADGSWQLTGDFVFDRQTFNVNYQNSGLLGVAKDKIIRDEVKVSFDFTFTL